MWNLKFSFPIVIHAPVEKLLIEQDFAVRKKLFFLVPPSLLDNYHANEEIQTFFSHKPFKISLRKLRNELLEIYKVKPEENSDFLLNSSIYLWKKKKIDHELFSEFADVYEVEYSWSLTERQMKYDDSTTTTVYEAIKYTGLLLVPKVTPYVILSGITISKCSSARRIKSIDMILKSPEKDKTLLLSAPSMSPSNFVENVCIRTLKLFIPSFNLHLIPGEKTDLHRQKKKRVSRFLPI